MSDRIGALAENLPLGVPYSIYERYKKNGNWAWANYPFGIGSLVLGDYGAAALQVGGEAIGASGFAVGFVLKLASGRGDDFNSTAVMVVSGTVFWSALVFGMVRPWFYVEEENQELSEALGL